MTVTTPRNTIAVVGIDIGKNSFHIVAFLGGGDRAAPREAEPPTPRELIIRPAYFNPLAATQAPVFSRTALVLAQRSKA
ncbi:MAG TPA: hypothetical protein VGJ20_32200 [Xanthobacteraceae bacterium]|jgi:hypothetical protein